MGTHGTINKRTRERLVEMRRKMALGYSDFEIKDQMKLSRAEWLRLLEHHYEGADFTSTIHQWANFQARKGFQYQELVRGLQNARGIDNPRWGQPGEPRFLEKPNEKDVAVLVRGMAELDRDSIATGLRLAVFPVGPVAEGGVAAEGAWRQDDPRTWSEPQLRAFKKTGELPIGPERVGGVLGGAGDESDDGSEAGSGDE